MTRITAVRGDLTAEVVDAIVNAANYSLLGGGGVDGAIHRAAGPRLLEACRELRRTAYPDGLPTGYAVATPGFDLPARFVIHTVGPVWHGGGRDEDRLLASCYRRSLEIAHGHGLRSIAFPAISTGIYRFPAARAAAIAVAAVRAFAADHDLPEHIVFCCFGAESAELHRAALAS